MNGPLVFQMWTVLLLTTITGVGRAQVSTARAMRGNIRRDGEAFDTLFVAVCRCIFAAVYLNCSEHLKVCLICQCVSVQ